MSNKNLRDAKRAKNDEFYTRMEDINNELQHYTEHFRGKTIYCNCDDPRCSNFFKYFALNFNNFGLKKLITTCYKNQNADLFSENNSESAVWLEYMGNPNDPTSTDFSTIKVEALKGNGDFRSEECIELLKEADIVVTNPPFSNFRDYIAQLIKYDKKFIVMGNMNAITYKEIFPLFRDNKIWLGYSIHSGDVEFEIPKHYVTDSKSLRTDVEGKRFVRVPGVRWYTNLDHNRRHEDLILYKHYTPEEYPKYDNYDAINVDKTADIPMDYDGVMGVPISFMDKYNPEQFEILGITQRNNDSYKIKKYTKLDYKNANDLNAGAVIIINDIPKTTYARVLVKHKPLQG